MIFKIISILTIGQRLDTATQKVADRSDKEACEENGSDKNHKQLEGYSTIRLATDECARVQKEFYHSDCSGGRSSPRRKIG